MLHSLLSSISGSFNTVSFIFDILPKIGYFSRSSADLVFTKLELYNFDVDAPILAPQGSMQSSRVDVVPQSQIEDPTFNKPRIANVSSQMGIPGIKDNAPANSLYKTDLCKNFMAKGKCRYGETCIFAHGFRNRRDPLGCQKSGAHGKMYRNANVVNETRQERGTCRFLFFKKGCPYGERCIFTHHGLHKSNENRHLPWDSSVIDIQAAAFDSKTNPWLKTRQCNQWMMLNRCDYGAKCSFAHGQEELRTLSSSLKSELGNAWIAPKTLKKDHLPENTEEPTAKQEVAQTICPLKWKTTKKIVGVYGDWIDEKSNTLCTASKQVQ